MAQVKLKIVKTETVEALKITALAATLEDGSTLSVTGPISVGDYSIKDATGNVSVLSAADFAADVVA